MSLSVGIIMNNNTTAGAGRPIFFDPPLDYDGGFCDGDDDDDLVDEYHEHVLTKAALCILYGLVFSTAVCGNSLVVYAVCTNKSMQSVTNLFIMNLAVSDILVNFTSLWLTPTYAYLQRWVWGQAMCHLVPLFQGMSTFISALTLMAIAIDRYVAILHPFRARISVSACGWIVAGIWFTALVLVTPLAAQMHLDYDPDCNMHLCREEWRGFPEIRVVYGFVVLSLQFGLPFMVIAFCYVSIWLHLMYRRSMVVTMARYSSDERRKRRLLKMLVAMVVIYLLAWFPVNLLNVLRDATNIGERRYFTILFLFAHLCSMSATCWNPVVYAWMNENFRREFKAILPCFKHYERFDGRTQSITTCGAGGRRSTPVVVFGGDANGAELRPIRHKSLSPTSPTTMSPFRHNDDDHEPTSTDRLMDIFNSNYKKSNYAVVTRSNPHTPQTRQRFAIGRDYHRSKSTTQLISPTENGSGSAASSPQESSECAETRVRLVQ